MKKLKKFQANDKVFAKVRGYPPWPAKVVGVADESSRMKYHIYFYGTGETAVVKAEDVFSYVENKNGKLGKPRKLKGFNEALSQIDGELTPEEKTAADNSPADTSVAAGEDSSTPAKRASIDQRARGSEGGEPDKEAASSTPVESKAAAKPRKRKMETPDLHPDTKRAKTEERGADDSRHDESLNKSKPDVTSRSGRKIKPKKFSDFDRASDEESVPKRAAPVKAKSVSRAEDVVTEDEVIFTRDEDEVRIPLNLNRPAFNNHKNSADWRSLVLAQAQALRGKVTAGQLSPEEAVREMDRFTKEKALEKKKEYEEEDDKYAVLQVEGRLLQLDQKIRASLGLSQADPDQCLEAMEELASLPVTSLMLKKNPETVETFKRLRRYVGNTAVWNMSADDRRRFDSQAEHIRHKADHVFNKMKGLFTVPPNKSFWSVFTTQLVDFNKLTKKLSQKDFCAIVHDPVH